MRAAREVGMKGRLMAPLGRLAAAWGVLGVVALLVEAIVRLGVHGWAALSAHPLTPAHWASTSAWCASMVFFEGYRGFQRSFSPRVVARAAELARAPTPGRVALAPLYCMGLWWAPRAVLVRQWTLVALVVGLVLVVARLEQPLRGLVDLGVVSGLGYGLGTLLTASARALAASRRPAPAPAPATSSSEA
jgi:hypothetical protein